MERLRALEALEASVPEMLAKAKVDADAERIHKLHEQRKVDPAAYSKKVLEKYHKNKEEINARRREAYRAKKENAGAAAGAGSA